MMPDFNVIGEYIRMMKFPDLPGIFVFTSDFDYKFMINQEVGLFVQKYLMIYTKLV